MNMRPLRNVEWTRGRIAVAAAILFLAGMWFRGCGVREPAPPADSAVAPPEGRVQIYTCSMHPQVRSPDPKDKCPLCAMDLIPVPSDGDDEGDGEGPPQLRLTESALALMEVRTQPVERRAAEIELRLFGRVGVDETRLAEVVARVDGYVEELAVRAPWTAVEKGETLAGFHSPAAVAALNELRAVRRGPDEMRDAALARVRRLGVPEDVAAAVLGGGEVPRTFPVASPEAGTAMPPMVRAGEFRREGERLFRIADLSRVWINAEGYERDLPWLRPGLPVSISVAGLPGEEFAGEVGFVEPVVADGTRTVRLRIEADNADGRLRPDQYVSAKVRAPYAWPGAGRARGEGGEAESEELGAHSSTSLDPLATATAPLVVPASAPLLTGKRALVYVRVPDADRPTFEPRAVVLGPRAGDVYVVKEGLREGDLVVVNGQFKIDSELQIRGRPSMMSAARGEGESGEGEQLRLQTHCPVMGGKIDPGQFADVDGKRIYVCCAGCDQMILADPATYVGKLEAEGVAVARLQTHCPVMNFPIDRSLFHDHDGWRIYVCCAGCLEDVRERADEMIREHAARGIVFERTPEEP